MVRVIYGVMRALPGRAGRQAAAGGVRRAQAGPLTRNDRQHEVARSISNQRPPIDQLVLIQLSHHARKLLPHPDTAATSDSALVCGW